MRLIGTIFSTKSGFKTIYKPKIGGLRFANLLDKVSLVDPEMRVRFISPHPKDFPDEVSCAAISNSLNYSLLVYGVRTELLILLVSDNIAKRYFYSRPNIAFFSLKVVLVYCRRFHLTATIIMINYRRLLSDGNSTLHSLTSCQHHSF